MKKTVDYYVLTKAERELRREISKFDGIEVCELGDGYDVPVSMGVNWASIGAVSADKAEEFAKRIMQAAELVKNFKYNGYMIALDD